MKPDLRFFLILLLGSVVACSPPSTTLQTEHSIPEEKVEIPVYEAIPQQEMKWVTENGGQGQLEFNPKIDILFVTDTSESMKSAQQNLKRNINKFTEGILRNRMIDYHIGVVSTWDNSERAVNAQKNSYALGELRRVQDENGKVYSQRFISRAMNAPHLIAPTLDIGIVPYASGGPEFEEFFLPLQSALEKTAPGQVNEGFLREDAQLVVVIMTDADESNNGISSEQMVQNLISFKKGQAYKISVYGVLVKAQDPDDKKDWDLRVHPKYRPECFDEVRKKKVNNGKCTGFGPARLEEFILTANSLNGDSNTAKSQFIMGITSDFGLGLKRIGSEIAVKTLEKTIFLEQRPRFDEQTKNIMIRVRYGTPQILQQGKGQIIPQGENGWLYNPADNSIHLSGHVDYQYVEGSIFAVDLVPLTIKKE